MSKRNKVAQVLMCIGAVVLFLYAIMLSGLYWRYINDWLSEICFLILLSVIALRWRNRQDHWVYLRIGATVLLGSIILNGEVSDQILIKGACSALFIVGVLLLKDGETAVKQTKLTKWGSAITNIYAAIMLLFAGYWLHLLHQLFANISDLMNRAEEVVGSYHAELWLGSMLCFFVLLCLIQFFAGCWHFVHFRGAYLPRQLIFGVCLFLVQLLMIIVSFQFNYFSYNVSNIRFIIMLNSPIYLIGTLLLFISARRKAPCECVS